MAGGPKKLEQYKYFSVFAWTLVFGFTGFVLYFALNLRETADRLQNNSMNLNQQMQDVDALFDQNPHATSSPE